MGKWYKIFIYLLTILLVISIASLFYLYPREYLSWHVFSNYGVHIYNKSLEIPLNYTVEGYWSKPSNLPKPSGIGYNIQFYNEKGVIPYTDVNIGEGNIVERGVEVSRGEVITVRIHLYSKAIGEYNATVYLFIDLIADTSMLEYYYRNGVTVYIAERGWSSVDIPSNIKLLTKPYFIKLEPGESIELEIKFKVLKSSPKDLYPIEISIDIFTLADDTLYWEGGGEYRLSSL
ncbi:hypothetical protein DRN87_01320 [Candidatus Geothermarchaeota archaeon]|nr:MAG: hypothetical protein DRN87_01320 [Candidatus Geothermarchaeota archaeon]